MVVLASMGCQAVQLHHPQSLFTPNGITSSSSSSSSISSSSSGCRQLRLPFGRLYRDSITTTTSALAADTAQPTSDDGVTDQTTQKYYFVVANAKFMLDEEEHFKELMFERLRLFAERNMEQDFWLLVEPNFLHKFPNITKRLNRPAVALVSTNRPWITYMKLRLDRVLSDSYEADSLEEALASNPVNLEFEKPEKWVAPYQKYEYGWWETFLPLASQKPQA
ncbi:hypothetical protein vseg_015489 [Gypsophila vaccaria]